jgi:anaphase-promoting complex subunit 4
LVQLGDGQIKSVRFMDDNILLVLWDSIGKNLCNSSICECTDSNIGTRSLLSLFYDTMPAGIEAPHLKYSSYMQDGGPYSPTVFSNEEAKSRLSKYKIANPGSFIPERMEVRERSQPREKVDTGRLVLLRDDKMYYKVFKFAEDAGADGGVPMS